MDTQKTSLYMRAISGFAALSEVFGYRYTDKLILCTFNKDYLINFFPQMTRSKNIILYHFLSLSKSLFIL